MKERGFCLQMKLLMTWMVRAEPCVKIDSSAGANEASLRPSRSLAKMMVGLEQEPKSRVGDPVFVLMLLLAATVCVGSAVVAVFELDFVAVAVVVDFEAAVVGVLPVAVTVTVAVVTVASAVVLVFVAAESSASGSAGHSVGSASVAVAAATPLAVAEAATAALISSSEASSTRRFCV